MLQRCPSAALLRLPCPLRIPVVCGVAQDVQLYERQGTGAVGDQALLSNPQACCDPITASVQGLGMVLSEGGAPLSAGQKQLAALARALLKRSKVRPAAGPLAAAVFQTAGQLAAVACVLLWSSRAPTTTSSACSL